MARCCSTCAGLMSAREVSSRDQFTSRWMNCELGFMNYLTTAKSWFAARPASGATTLVAYWTNAASACVISQARTGLGKSHSPARRIPDEKLLRRTSKTDPEKQPDVYPLMTFKFQVPIAVGIAVKVSAKDLGHD